MRPGLEKPTVARRQPTQRRSRERFDRILQCASAIIAERGSDGLKMSEIASRSGMSLGALYQYFPDKPAIIMTLAAHFNAASRACVAAGLAGVKDAAGLSAAFADLMEQYWDTVRVEPVMRDIWSGMQANKELAIAQSEESRFCAGLLSAALQQVHPNVARQVLDRTSLLVWELGETAVRLALCLSPAEADETIATYTRMSLRELINPV